MKKHFFFSCEHASNLLPRKYQHLIAPYWLTTHRGYDKGSAAFFEYLTNAISGPKIKAKYSRLLIDLNRSLDNPALFSKNIAALAQPVQQAIIDSYYTPYRNQVEHSIAKRVDQGSQVIHLSLHSFTPKLRGQQRHADVGLLFDPTREHESSFCRQLQSHLCSQTSQRVRMNYPYQGIEDGLTTHLRGLFPKSCYLGIEIELNQKIFSRSLHYQSQLFEAFAVFLTNWK